MRRRLIAAVAQQEAAAATALDAGASGVGHALFIANRDIIVNVFFSKCDITNMRQFVAWAGERGIR
jgi:hypothetical protein